MVTEKTLPNTMGMYILGPQHVAVFQEATKIIDKIDISTSDASTFLSDETVVVVVIGIGVQFTGMVTANVIRRPTDKILAVDEIYIIKKDPDKVIVSQVIEYLKDVCRGRGLVEMSIITNERIRGAVELFKRTGGTRDNDDDVIFCYDIKQ